MRCRVSIEEEANDHGDIDYEEIQYRIDEAIVDPDSMVDFLELTDELISALINITLIPDFNLDNRTRPLVECIKAQAEAYIMVDYVS